MAKIMINLSLRRLYFYKTNNLVKSYPIAIGKPATPTPTGHWKIIAKMKHPGGILGSRWLGLDIPNGPYGIHGTPNPWTIGKAISHGCIRMYNQDVEELFPQVSVGNSVIIISSWQNSGQIPPQPNHDPAQPAVNPGNSSTKTYVVQSGDTLWAIAKRYNVSLDELIRINHISNPDVLRVGQKIIIP